MTSHFPSPSHASIFSNPLVVGPQFVNGLWTLATPFSIARTCAVYPIEIESPISSTRGSSGTSSTCAKAGLGFRFGGCLVGCCATAVVVTIRAINVAMVRICSFMRVDFKRCGGKASVLFFILANVSATRLHRSLLHLSTKMLCITTAPYSKEPLGDGELDTGIVRRVSASSSLSRQVTVWGPCLAADRVHADRLPACSQSPIPAS